jgi:hypothetical protein
MQVRVGRGRPVELVPVPNRVLISAEEMGVYVVWHGAWTPKPPLPDPESIQALVDGQPVQSLS